MRRINIKDGLRVGDDCSAQVLLNQDSLVAKIYDPLYYMFIDSDRLDEKSDVTTEANSEFAIQAAAYAELQHSEAQGNIIPLWFGSWMLSLTTTIEGEHWSHEVPMIPIEYVPGITMLVQRAALRCTVSSHVT